jgi:cystathionine beta-lyase
MKYDFDREVNRTGTDCYKWDYFHAAGDAPRLLPMWIADMDFPCPAPVVEALVARASHGIFGYNLKSASYLDAVVRWMQRRHGWTIKPEWICVTPGVVSALNMLVRTFVEPGERVLVQPPIYSPFYSAALNNHAEVLTNPLTYEDGRYTMDFADLQEKVRDSQVKMAILCNPHNPVGRVWTPEELTRFGELCTKNGILVVSDEIHGDLIHRGNKFTPIASLDEPFASRIITCTAPSKTFNLAGLQTSNIIISDAALRAKFEQTLMGDGLGGLNSFGLVATETAYNQGEEWLEQLIDYLGGNLRCLEDYVAHEIPQVSVIHPEGTYLVWLDFSALGLGKREMTHLMRDTAGVVLNDGYGFGPHCEGFQRMNIACPRSILMEALERIKRSVSSVPVSDTPAGP